MQGVQYGEGVYHTCHDDDVDVRQPLLPIHLSACDILSILCDEEKKPNLKKKAAELRYQEFSLEGGCRPSVIFSV